MALQFLYTFLITMVFSFGVMLLGERYKIGELSRMWSWPCVLSAFGAVISAILAIWGF